LFDIFDVWMYCLIKENGKNKENMYSKLMLCIIESILVIHAFIQYVENM